MIEEGVDIQCKFPKFPSETRMSNWISLIYNEFRGYYAGLMVTLKECKESVNSGDSNEKKKADNASQIIRTISNLKWVLTLSLCCDIYKVYSTGVNILQVFYLYDLS